MDSTHLLSWVCFTCCFYVAATGMHSYLCLHGLNLSSVHVLPIYYFTPILFPYGVPVDVQLSLDNAPPTSFSVQMFATNAIITPEIITFTDSGSLDQNYSIISRTFGLDIISYTINGNDADLVDPLLPVNITVIQCMYTSQSPLILF